MSRQGTNAKSASGGAVKGWGLLEFLWALVIDPRRCISTDLLVASIDFP